MTETRTDLQEIIEYIHPADLTYQEWVNVGMALKHEGYSVDVWDAAGIRGVIMPMSVKRNGRDSTVLPALSQAAPWCRWPWSMAGSRPMAAMNYPGTMKSICRELSWILAG